MIPDSQGILTIDNVPEGVRIYDSLKVYKAPAKFRWRPATEPRLPSEGTGRSKPIFIWHNGVILSRKSRDAAMQTLGIIFSTRASYELAHTGFYRFARSGRVVWYQDKAIPECVPKPWIFEAAGK